MYCWEVRLVLPNARVLNIAELPVREQYGPRSLVLLHQRGEKDSVKLTCKPEHGRALSLAGDGPVTVELGARPISTPDNGVVFKLTILAVGGEEQPE